jgi:hypothetical protein
MAAPAPDVKGINTHETDKESGAIDEEGYATSQATYRVPTVQDAATYGPSTDTLGLRLVSRSWNKLTGGLGYEVTLSYKGKIENPDDNGSEGDYSMDISFSEEPIEKHHNLVKIMETYLGSYGEEDKVVFEPELPTGGTALGGGGGDGPRKNPMFGVKTFLALSGVFRHSYTSNRRPKLSVIGNLTDKVPGGFDTPEDHNWLVMPPKMKRQGREGYAITQEYLLSQRGGWPEEVYATLGTNDHNDDEYDDPLDLGEEPIVNLPPIPPAF